MAAPDKTKKLVNQTGYRDDVAPFTDNYQELYREMLIKHRLLYEMVDVVVDLLDQIGHVRINNIEQTKEIGQIFELIKEINEVIRPGGEDE